MAAAHQPRLRSDPRSGVGLNRWSRRCSLPNRTMEIPNEPFHDSRPYRQIPTGGEPRELRTGSLFRSIGTAAAAFPSVLLAVNRISIPAAVFVVMPPGARALAYRQI